VRLLLDTHTLLWWLAGDARLPPAARAVIDHADSTAYVSAATAWEVATKYRLGKLPGAGLLAADFAGTITRHGFEPLDVTLAHGQAAGALPGLHKDPLDRMLIAQALTERLALVSNEVAFDRYGVVRVW
jgi:PIN domain nuclease of toxin-antitoxin system